MKRRPVFSRNCCVASETVSPVTKTKRCAASGRFACTQRNRSSPDTCPGIFRSETTRSNERRCSCPTASAPERAPMLDAPADSRMVSSSSRTLGSSSTTRTDTASCGSPGAAAAVGGAAAAGLPAVADVMTVADVPAEAETGPLADFLGGVEVLEDTVRLADARTVVEEVDADRLVAGRRPDDQLGRGAGAPQRVIGVVDDVHEDLLQLQLAGEDAALAVSQLEH